MPKVQIVKLKKEDGAHKCEYCQSFKSANYKLLFKGSIKYICENCLKQKTTKREPYTRGQEKVGRNELCPCGSEKKYKHCCGNR